VIVRCRGLGLRTNLVVMILHSALLAANAEAHRHDMLAAAERHRTAKAVRAWRRAVATVARPDPIPPTAGHEEIPDENRRYAVSR
jgi:hypothetical protein